MGRYSNIQTQKREQFKGAIDEFCTFKWNDLDSWDEFGAFIIADKRGDLKASSGPSFTNNYSKPQFESAAGQLQGITFNTKQISIKVGVYWASMADYRKFLNWLHPYEVADLQFGYDKDYAYFCKLAKIDDASKYVVGHQGGEAMYYFETNLTFELQGEACAHSKESYNWDFQLSDSSTVNQERRSLTTTHDDLILDYSNIKQTDFFPNSQSFWKCTNHLGSSELETYFKITTQGFKWGRRDWEFDVKIGNRSCNFNTNLEFYGYFNLPSANNTSNIWTLPLNFIYRDRVYKEIKVEWTKTSLILNKVEVFFDTFLVYSESLGAVITNKLNEIYILDNDFPTWITENLNGDVRRISSSIFLRWLDANLNTPLSDKLPLSGVWITGTANSKSWLSGYLKSIKGELFYNSEDVVDLFTIKFKSNLIPLDENLNTMIFNYNSQNGVVSWGSEDLLIPLNYFSVWNNKKCIDLITTTNVSVPGCLYYPQFNYSNLNMRILFDVEQAKFHSKDLENIELTVKYGSLDSLQLTTVADWITADLANVREVNCPNTIIAQDKIDITMYSKRSVL